MVMRLEVRNLRCGYGRKAILKDISFSIQSGEVLCLLGCNGCGKTTFIKTLLGLLPAKSGNILLDGQDIRSWSNSRIARVMAYIPQSHQAAFPFRVLDMVLMGRTAHLKTFATPSDHDIEVAEAAMATLNIIHLRNRVYTELSGGERQLVLIARALAQEPSIMVMDEPTCSLDFGHQAMVMEQVEKLARRNLAVVMSSHFPSHAFLYSDKVLLFNAGQVLKMGDPQEIVTEQNLKKLYGIDVEIMDVVTRNNKEVKICLPVAQ